MTFDFNLTGIFLGLLYCAVNLDELHVEEFFDAWELGRNFKNIDKKSTSWVLNKVWIGVFSLSKVRYRVDGQ